MHRHHPPLVYGRMHTADPEHSIGIAVCETSASITGGKLYAAITYECAPPVQLVTQWWQHRPCLHLAGMTTLFLQVAARLCSYGGLAADLVSRGFDCTSGRHSSSGSKAITQLCIAVEKLT